MTSIQIQNKKLSKIHTSYQKAKEIAKGLTSENSRLKASLETSQSRVLAARQENDSINDCVYTLARKLKELKTDWIPKTQNNTTFSQDVVSYAVTVIDELQTELQSRLGGTMDGTLKLVNEFSQEATQQSYLRDVLVQFFSHYTQLKYLIDNAYNKETESIKADLMYDALIGFIDKIDEVQRAENLDVLMEG